MLGFHDKGIAVVVNDAIFAGDLAVQEIAGVELQAGFGGGDFQDATGGGLGNASLEGHFSVRIVNDPVVVVATAEFELFVVLADAGADGRGGGEVKRGAFDGAQFAKGDERAVNRGEFVGVEVNRVVQDVAFAGEVPVTVVGEVDDGVFVCGGREVHAQGVFIGEGVNRRDGEIAGVAFFAILGDIGQFQGRAFAGGDGLGVPEDLVEAFQAAVQGIDAVVNSAGVFLAVEGVLAFGDAVAEASDESAEIGAFLEVASQIVIAQGDVGVVAVFIRRSEGNNEAAVVGNAGLAAFGIGQCINISFLTIRKRAPDCFGGFGARFLLAGAMFANTTGSNGQNGHGTQGLD